LEIAECYAQVAVPEFCQQSYEIVGQRLILLAKRECALDTLMERWLEFE